MRLDSLPDQRLTIVGGNGRIGEPLAYAAVAGWMREALNVKDVRVAVIAPNASLLSYWTELAGIKSWGADHERTAIYAASAEQYQRPPSSLAANFAESIRRHKADVVFVLDHVATDPAQWAWLNKIQSVQRAVVLTPTALESGLRFFPDAVDNVTKPTLCRGTLVSDDGIARDITVTGTGWEAVQLPEGMHGEMHEDKATAAKWTWANSRRDPIAEIQKWADAAKAAQLEAEQDAARSELARNGYAPTLAAMPKALRAAAPWLASDHTSTPNNGAN